MKAELLTTDHRVLSQKLRSLWARQVKRWHTLRRSFRAGNDEDKYRVVQGIVTHLPMLDKTRFRILNWTLERLSNRQQQIDIRLQIQKAQADWDARGHRRLEQVLAGNEYPRVPSYDRPTVSIILVTQEKAHLSILTIDSVLQFAGEPFEFIIVDNGSKDATPELLDRIRGARILRNQTNLGFGPACMQAAALAAGEFLCFLNNDALLTEGAIQAALKNFESKDVGAVGGKILLSNGSLQEAGSMIWSDGSALGYGRGDDASLPQYNFRRPVDYCSAVFLITPKGLFQRFGGFREEFAPAYYEDSDYCMTLWHAGLHVIYEPLAEIRHYESASSGGNDLAAPMMAAHQVKFRKKWASELDKHYQPDRAHVTAARIAVHSRSLRIVYVDDRIPKRTLGAGFPRSNDIVKALAQMGHQLVCSTSTFPLLGAGYDDIPREVELFDGFRNRQKLVEEYMPCADIVWVSRPHNLKLLRRDFPSALTERKFSLIYDSEAIFAPRAETKAELLGPATTKADSLEPSGLVEELTLAKMADVVTVVSESDRQVMLTGGVFSVHILGHGITVNPTSRPFHERSDFLFVGSVHGSDDPNADSIREFYRTQWAKIQCETGARFIVAGFGTEQLRSEITDPSVRILGKQDDLRPLYERARVFVVPTRFAAGMPFKAHEAAGHGIPMVVSNVIANQMQWTDGRDYLAARDLDDLANCCIQLYHDHNLWAGCRENSLERVKLELCPTAFVESLQAILEKARDYTLRGVEFAKTNTLK